LPNVCRKFVRKKNRNAVGTPVYEPVNACFHSIQVHNSSIVFDFLLLLLLKRTAFSKSGAGAS